MMRLSHPPEFRSVLNTEAVILMDFLSEHPLENAYLRGLLFDYSLKELHRLEWGEFYIHRENGFASGVFYLDVTGLLIMAQPSPEGIASFAEFLFNKRRSVRRIIAEHQQVVALHTLLAARESSFLDYHQWFEESGMVLNRSQIISPSSDDKADLGQTTVDNVSGIKNVEKNDGLGGGVRLADPVMAREIAEGSRAAMKEELGIHMSSYDFEQLVRSKTDLIERRRYYVYEREGIILFQAYLSSVLPEAAQIQGVYVPPIHRCRGLATRCMLEVCRHACKHNRQLVLRVQKRNLPALAVYRKIGFTPFMDYLSIWYSMDIS